jgi:hypothetical protein
VYKILVGRPERKRPFERPWHRWEDIRMNLREIQWDGVGCMHLAPDTDQWQVLANMVM